MPVMGEITVGDDVEIAFAAASNNAGTTIITTGYVPAAGKAPAPVVPPALSIAAGGSGNQNTTVSEALALVIDVNIPDIGGGSLTVSVNGNLKHKRTITNDVTWTYVVVV